MTVSTQLSEHGNVCVCVCGLKLKFETLVLAKYKVIHFRPMLKDSTKHTKIIKQKHVVIEEVHTNVSVLYTAQ